MISPDANIEAAVRIIFTNDIKSISLILLKLNICHGLSVTVKSFF